jgi:hypothetical protein
VYVYCYHQITHLSFGGDKNLSLEAGDLFVFSTDSLLVKKLFNCVCVFLKFLYSKKVHLPRS